MDYKWLLRLVTVLICSVGATVSQRNNRKCGRRSVGENRIVDGLEAVRGSHPWLVSLEYTDDGGETWRHVCGGTILKKKWIVTAAHCFMNVDDYPITLDTSVKNWRVVGGDHDKLFKEASEQILKPVSILLHGNFSLASEFNSEGDIAMVKLNGSLITSSQWSKQVCRPRASTTFNSGTHCEVAGWGDVEARSRTPGSESRLQYYNSTIVPMDECKSVAESNGRRVLDNMICMRTEYDASIGRGTGGVCSGDSGGTLVCKVGSQYYIAGIVSWSMLHSCGRTHDVFTRFQSYAPWVNDIMRSDQNKN